MHWKRYSKTVENLEQIRLSGRFVTNMKYFSLNYLISELDAISFPRFLVK